MKLVQRRPRGKDSALIPAFQGISNCVRSSSTEAAAAAEAEEAAAHLRMLPTDDGFPCTLCETFNFQFLSTLFVNSFIFERGHLKKVPDCS